jgi:hypothetical protein
MDPGTVAVILAHVAVAPVALAVLVVAATLGSFLS